MTVEEIYKDRKKFSKQVFEVASSDLVNMGITVVSYTIKDIRDEEYSDDCQIFFVGWGWCFLPHIPTPELGFTGSRIKNTAALGQGYLKSLGMARTAEVKRDARIGEAEARAEAQIKEAIAEEQRMASVFLNDTEIAKARRDFELKKAAYDVEVQTKNAEAEMAYELQAAKTKQKIKEEEMQIKVVERTQQIAVQDQEIARKERELEATVRRPAEAEKFRLEKIAEANFKRVLLEAEAEAEAVRLKGEAEAYAIEAKAKADAEQMAKKAEAWKEYKEAAMVDMFLEALPKKEKLYQNSEYTARLIEVIQNFDKIWALGTNVAGYSSQNPCHRKTASSDLTVAFKLKCSPHGLLRLFFYTLKIQLPPVAAPLSQAKKITMVSTGTGDVGAAKLTSEVLNIVTSVPQLVKTMTGVDISKFLIQKHELTFTSKHNGEIWLRVDMTIDQLALMMAE
ncbi:hypothetical protein NQ318_005934 [Aromia moschata]|uniref:Flotillin-like n=1 Tax=Aromia moschata TaxID=1265417 RepID=A0AAV8XJZ8_9CUCU|nr:hypothetical protein NQ318_005934 [Aromia moschata]